ncbi:MAG: undecaprenyldiphospho-muramoylpentapeptide beta-N-acetylglucosaminyltransferase [Acutalibacteraceae bacterium]|nr:undecaprenyldiphospho-muramoylpentapeptide beta-N-acetylglucosaminyltransferase [Acutalibacteraceae bacterium]
MKVLLAGGGTAGHINPALAIAGTVKNKIQGSEILYVGATGGMEEKLVPKAGYNFKSVKISGFKRSFSPKAIVHNIATVKRAVTASMQAKKIIKEFKPDICVGTGGYVSGPVLRAASQLGIPTIIHEQNAFPGVTNKMLAKNAKVVMLANPDAKERMGGNYNFAITGNPVRPEILKADKQESRKKLGLDDRPVILSFGGSLGARKINESVADYIARSGKDGKYQIIHAYGQYGTWFPELLSEKGCDYNKCDNLDIREFIHDMPVCLAAADLVVCRAGAMTISELQAQGKPAVLIPSPNVAENHQFHNAMSLVNANAASVIEEKDLTPEKLTETVDEMVKDPQKLQQYSENARKTAITDSNERILAIIKKVVKI